MSETNSSKSGSIFGMIILAILIMGLGIVIGYLIKESEVNSSVSDTIEQNQSERQEAVENKPPAPADTETPPVEETATPPPAEES